MGFKLILLLVLFGIVPLFVFTGCGDLEPDMQDTRTVSLNMDFHGKSSSRSSSSVSAAELSQYNTHLILALPSWEDLTSNYRIYYSSFAQGLMNTADKKVSLEIPLNTQMKIFGFLFKETYSLSDLISGFKEVGYYGESQPFAIDEQTYNLSLGISLQSTDTGDSDVTDPDTDNDGEDKYDDEADTFDHEADTHDVEADSHGVGEDMDTGPDTTAPTASVTEATITSSENAVVQSTETGTAYLVNTSVTISNLVSINWADDNMSNSVAIDVANINTDLPATGLVDGTYKVYAVDLSGNLSGASADNVTIDLTAPTVTFSPTDNATGVAISVNITFTFGEAVRNIDNTELTDSDLGSLITLKLDDASGNNVTFDATINADKTVITINPNSDLPNSQDVYVAIGTTVEDTVGNTITAVNATFTTVALQPSLATEPPLENPLETYSSSTNKHAVSTLGHLSYIAQNTIFWDKAFIQTADIDATVTKYWDDTDDSGGVAGDRYNDDNDETSTGINEGFLPIGSNRYSSSFFTGEYDGGGYSINNLTINRPSSSQYIGFFGQTQNATIKNLSLTNDNVTGKTVAATLVGLSRNTTIDNCSSSGNVSGISFVGGLIGYHYQSSIVRNSYSTVSVSGSGNYVGGLVGYLTSSTILNSYSTGGVMASSVIRGGLVGTRSSSTITDSFYDATTSGQSDTGKGTGKTTAEMKTLATFTDTATTGLSTSWDFDTIWNIDNTSTINNGYPYLR